MYQTKKIVDTYYWIGYNTQKQPYSDFPGGPVVKNPPSNAGVAGSIPGRWTKISHATWQLSLRMATREPVCRKLQSPHVLELVCRNKEPAHHNEEPARCNEDPACCN